MKTALMPSLKMIGKMMQLATYISITPIHTPLQQNKLKRFSEQKKSAWHTLAVTEQA